jgi:SHAQKYF class myb-like DNA-binding protein
MHVTPSGPQQGERILHQQVANSCGAASNPFQQQCPVTSAAPAAANSPASAANGDAGSDTGNEQHRPQPACLDKSSPGANELVAAYGSRKRTRAAVEAGQFVEFAAADLQPLQYDSDELQSPPTRKNPAVSQPALTQRQQQQQQVSEAFNPLMAMAAAFAAGAVVPPPAPAVPAADAAGVVPGHLLCALLQQGMLLQQQQQASSNGVLSSQSTETAPYAWLKDSLDAAGSHTAIATAAANWGRDQFAHQAAHIQQQQQLQSLVATAQSSHEGAVVSADVAQQQGLQVAGDLGQQQQPAGADPAAAATATAGAAAPTAVKADPVDASVPQHQQLLWAAAGQNDRPHKQQRSSRMVWDGALHLRFMQAAMALGVDTVTPKALLQALQEPWLSRENVASHLQKYR